MFESVLFEKRNGIGYVTVNRPKALNALNMATMEELRAAFSDIQQDGLCVRRILTGAGEKALWLGPTSTNWRNWMQCQARYSRCAGSRCWI